MYQKVVFICTGNTCRSPMAEAAFRKVIENTPLLDGLEVCSRGLVVLFPEPVNPKAETILTKYGMHMKQHTTRQFQSEDISDGALLLTMTNAQKSRIIATYGVRKELFTLKEYVGAYGDVIDPYGGTLAEYEACYKEIASLVEQLGSILAEACARDER